MGIEPNTEQSDGLISIENGQIVIQDPQNGGKKAEIQASDSSVLVFVNEVEVRNSAEVTSDTHLRLTLPVRSLPECSYQIEIDEDKMQAWLTITLTQPGYYHELVDISPRNRAVISTRKIKMPLTAFPEILQDIHEALKMRGIVAGISHEKIQEAMEHVREKICVATGKMPVTRDDSFQFHFGLHPPVASEKILLSEETHLVEGIRLCQAGDLLVTKLPGEALESGITVTGKELPPRPPQQKELLAADRSVRIENQGLRAVACIEGVPSFNGKEVRVMPMQVRTDDIEGIREGSIDAKGSLRIEGNVNDRSQVWSDQNIEIMGDVSHAQLEAEENLLVHGRVIQGKLATGGDAAASMRLIPHVEKLLELLDEVSTVFERLKDTVPALARHDDKTVIINLIKTQYTEVTETVEQLWQFNKTLKQLHPRKTLALKVVLSNLMNMEERDFERKEFRSWIENMTVFLEDLRALEGTTSDMYLTYVQGSTLTCSGHIYVLGEGGYNSHLVSQQNILVVGEPGYFREGSMKAEGCIFVKELGSPNASTTTVHLPISGELYARLIYPGVTIHFGDQLEKAIMEPLHYIKVYIEDDRICMSHFQTKEENDIISS